MKKVHCLGVGVFMFICLSVQYSHAFDDISAIIETSKNYMHGWYQGDEDKMARSLHPKLAKRSLRKTSSTTDLRNTTASEMISYTEQGFGQYLWDEKYKIEVIVLDQFEDIANVKIIAPHYLEYLHLVKLNGNWLIINALYSNKKPE